MPKKTSSSLKNILQEMTIREFHKLIKNSESTSEIAFKLIGKRSTDTLLRLYGKYGTNFDELRLMSVEKAKVRFGSAYDEKIKKSWLKLKKSALKNKTLQDIHLAIITNLGSHDRNIRNLKLGYTKVANSLGMHYESLLICLVKQGTTYHQLAKLSKKDAKNKFSNYKKPLINPSLTMSDFSDKIIIETVKKSPNITYAACGYFGIRRKIFLQELKKRHLSHIKNLIGSNLIDESDLSEDERNKKSIPSPISIRRKNKNRFFNKPANSNNIDVEITEISLGENTAETGQNFFSIQDSASESACSFINHCFFNATLSNNHNGEDISPTDNAVNDTHELIQELFNINMEEYF